jgi:hypothetical protein
MGYVGKIERLERKAEGAQKGKRISTGMAFSPGIADMENNNRILDGGL